MEFVKQWTMCVCVTLVIASLFSLFTPQGNMKGFYNIIISVFVFISFLYPVKDYKKSDFKLNTDSSFSVVDDNRTSVYENAVSSQIKELLDNYGISGTLVSTRLSFKTENEISIDDVQISIPDEYSKKAVEKIVFDELGISVRVLYIGE